VWRYYLLVNRPEHSDSDFSWEDLALKNNNELLANLGNLVHRTLQFIYHKCDGKIPLLKRDLLTEVDIDFVAEMKSRYAKYRDMVKKIELKEGLKFCMETSSRGNKYLQDSQFWEEHHRKAGR
jgi:methionyl-tRNA synthetase